MVEEADLKTQLDSDLQRIRTEFVASVWRALFWVALLVLPLTMLRIWLNDWLPLYGYHLGIGVFALLLCTLQARLPFAWRKGILIGLLWLVGMPGVFSFGLSAPGVWWLVLSCLVASILYSARFGALLAVATGLVLVVAAAGFISGVRTPLIPAERYISLPSAWIGLIIITGTFMALVLRSLGGYTRAIERLLLRIKQQRDEIERLSMLDPLTGLPLAGLAGDRIQMAMHSARRAGKRVALLYVDLDGFKRVNDSLGHDAGDEVLRTCALRMRDCLRSEDTVARVGGDEFIVVVGAMAESAQAGRIAEKLVNVMTQPIVMDGRQLSVGASIGIAIYPDDAEDVMGLRRLADLAMYEAKRQGRGRYEYAREPAAERADFSPAEGGSGNRENLLH